MSASEPNANNFAFIYMPFVCRGKKLGSYQKVGMPKEDNVKHWKLVGPRDTDAQEEEYLYSYVSGVQLGQERPSTYGQKYCHYVFTGKRSSLSECGHDSFLTILKEVVAEQAQSNSLYNLQRKMQDDGPICDGGSSYLAGKSLGQLFFDSKSVKEDYVYSLNVCTCWRIRKAHRFPPLKDCLPKDGERFDEESQNRRYISFDILRVHCYWFSTGIAILAFEISFRMPSSSELEPQNTPYWVSSALFHLKKIQSVRILPTTDDYVNEDSPIGTGQTGPEGISFCNLGKLLASDLLDVPISGKTGDQGRPYLFYQIPASTYKGPNGSAQKSMRSNSFSFVILDDDKEGRSRKALKDRKALYYLTHCFDINVPYSSDSTLPMDALGSASDIRWGIATENTSCLALSSNYVLNHHTNHVRYQFQFIYVLLLHQKYFYYFLLSQIVGARFDDLNAIVKHRDNLERFNAAFTFSRITEVVQYQQFYEVAGQAMGLDQLKADVREPLEQLSSQQQERDSKTIEHFGIFLALLGLLSVVCDVCTFLQFRPQGTEDWIVMATSVALVIVVAIFIVRRDRIAALYRTKKRTQ